MLNGLVNEEYLFVLLTGANEVIKTILSDEIDKHLFVHTATMYLVMNYSGNIGPII